MSGSRKVVACVVGYGKPSSPLYEQLDVDGVDDIVYLDNGSDPPLGGCTHRIDTNLGFTCGRRMAAEVARSIGCTHLVVLDDDVELRPGWLPWLSALHKTPGWTGMDLLGCGPMRTDAWFGMVEEGLYYPHPHYAHWWSHTLLQADLLRRGHAVRAVTNHPLVRHLGRAGRVPREKWRGMEVTGEQARGWFLGLPPIDIV